MVPSLSDKKVLHGWDSVVPVTLVVTYRTIDRVPVVIFSGHFVPLSGLVQATEIKESLPELVGDRDA